MKLNFINQCKSEFTADHFLPLLQKAATLLEIPEQEVELVLIDDAAIQKINRDTRGKDVPTDVLSFANREIEEESMRDDESLGQIFISVEAAARNATEMQQTLEEEVQFLFVHGVLHCVGYDHQAPADESAMKEMVYKILGRI